MRRTTQWLTTSCLVRGEWHDAIVDLVRFVNYDIFVFRHYSIGSKGVGVGIFLAMLGLAITSSGAAQSKVDAPEMFRARAIQTSSKEQVRTCLFVAKEISDLTDRADVARTRGDTDTFNSTVVPYNSAVSHWNGECLKPYKPADMVRAENESDMRLCELTRKPCLSEAERSAILAQEAARQKKSATSQGGLQKSTHRVQKLIPAGL